MNDIKKKYIDTFFSQLTEKDKKECYFDDQYMWHAFSYGKIQYVDGEKAIREFEKRKNNDVYLIFQHNDKVIEKKDLTYENLIKMILKGIINDDCYVIDKNFEWCFVFTHETDINIEGRTDWENPYYIGPFFSKLNNEYDD